MSRPARSAVLATVSKVLVAGLAAAAAVPFDALYLDHGPLRLAAGAALLALLWAVVARRLGVLAAAAGHVVAVCVYLTFVVFDAGTVGLSELRAVWDGATGGWAQLLGSPPPLVSTAELAVVPVVITWLAAAVGVELASRTPSAVPPVVPAFGAYTAALLFTGHQPPTPVAAPIGIVVGALLVILVRNGSPGAGRQTQRLWAGGMAVVLLGVIGALGASGLPLTSEARRVDLHDHYDPKVEVDEAISPLSRVRPQLNDPSDAPLFTVRFSGVPAGVDIRRLPVAVLESYDGAVWGTDDRFRTVGGSLPPDPSAPESGPGPVIEQHYQLDAYPSAFLPALQRPRAAHGADLVFAPDTGILATPSRPPPGFAYDVDSVIAEPSPDELTAAPPGNDITVADLVNPPGGEWPAEIQRFKDSIAPQEKNRYVFLTALKEELSSSRFGYAKDAPPGHTMAHLSSFLAPPASGGGTSARIGNAEQVAAAFAVAARARGIASRVVVGYRIEPELARQDAPVPVVPSAAHAWAEAYFRGVGWVTFDPTNPTERSAQPPDDAALRGPRDQSERKVDEGLGPAVPEKAMPTPPVRDSSPFPIWQLLTVMGLLLVLAPVAVVTTKAARRQRRRHRGAPAVRALAAWSEVRDTLGSHGWPIPPSMTVADSAQLLDTAGRADLGDPLDRVLAPIVDLALYSRHDLDENAASVAWDAHDDVRDALRHSTRTRRLRAALDPRPLTPHRRGDPQVNPIRAAATRRVPSRSAGTGR